MAADEVIEEANNNNRHSLLTKSSIVLGEWKDNEGSRKFSVAAEGMMLKPGDGGNDIKRWREEATKKKKELQSTSKGMR